MRKVASFGLILALCVMNVSSATAYVTTDKDDYSPGSVVTISGDNRDDAGYVVGETVEIEVATPYGSESGSAVVNDSGAFIWQFTLPADDSAVGDYSYIVTGLESGVVQYGVFTDNKNFVLTFAGTGGGSITFSGVTGIPLPSTNPCTGTCSNALHNDATGTLTVTASVGSVFAGWSGVWDTSGGGSTTCTSTTSLCTFSLGNKAQALTATFNLSAVIKIDPTVSVTNSPVIYTGSPQVATVSGSVAGVVSDVKYDGSSTAPTDVGTYAVTADFVPTDTATYNSLNDASAGNFVIEKADPICNIIAYDVTYDGLAHTATGECKGVLDEVLSGLVLSGTTHTSAGSYPTDPWTFTDVTGNYNNDSGTVADNIDKADAICVITGYAVLYDGLPHTATGSCSGIFAEPLTILDLSGTTHTAGGSYNDPWTFTDVTGNYNDQAGIIADVIIAAQPPITISKKEFQKGSTIPVKIPSSIAGWTVKLYVCGDVPAFCGYDKVAVSSGKSNDGNMFRYDESGEKYIYNLSTKLTPGFSSGSKFSLWITIDGIVDIPFKLATISIK